jgi:hypothetical protein
MGVEGIGRFFAGINFQSPISVIRGDRRFSARLLPKVRPCSILARLLIHPGCKEKYPHR